MSSDRLATLFSAKKDILSIYLTAGYPAKDDTVTVIKALVDAGVEMIEIGIPFSDPLADGPVIQGASEKALENGMTLPLLFSQLQGIRKSVQIPLLLMGYFNPIMQYGIEKFCSDAVEIGIDGVIIPDLPLEEYERHYKAIFAKTGLHVVLFVSPTTSAERMRHINSLSTTFIYAVSSPAVTGNTLSIGTAGSQGDVYRDYFEKLQKFGFSHPLLIGFGISSRESFKEAARYASGAIIGSAFVKALKAGTELVPSITAFIRSIR